MELFLVQVDLQVIMEIIDHFPESKFTLKDIVQIRSKTRDVKQAITFLEQKPAKRTKREDPRGDDVSHQRHGSRHTHGERIDSTPSDADASADQSTSRKPKRSVLSKVRDDVAADTDDSSPGSTVSKRKPSGGAPTGYKLLSGNSGARFHSINGELVPEHDLYGVSPEGNQRNGVTQHNVDASHRALPEAGSSYAAKQLKHNADHSTPSQGASPSELKQRDFDERYSTFPQSGSLRDANQQYQDPRYRTLPQTGPSYPSDNTERSQLYHRMPHSGRPSHPDGTEERMDSAMTTSPHETVTPLHLTSQYSGERYAGSLRDDRRGNAVFTQSSSVLPSGKVDTNGYHSTSSSRTETLVHVSAFGNARYANLQDSNYFGQKFTANESDRRMSTKGSAGRHDDRDAKYRPTGTTSSEPMEVEQREDSRLSRNDTTSQHNGMAEGAYGKTTVQSGLTYLDATLRHHLTIESNVHVAGKELQKVSSTSSDHGKQPGSERVTGAQATGSRAGSLKGAQPPRFHYQPENYVTCKEATRKSGSSAAADLKDHSAAKTESKDSSPGPSRRTSAQQDQTPGTSSKNDTQDEISREKGAKGTAICEFCELQGAVICRSCLKIVCINCMRIYTTDLCELTKGQHTWIRLTDIETSGDSSQESANTNEASGDGENDWSCSRCTLLNDPKHRICVACGATRGIGVVENTKPGSKVCRNCTLHNEETAAVCTACRNPLSKSETVV